MNAALKQKNIRLLTAFFNKECMCLYRCHGYLGMQRAFFYAAHMWPVPVYSIFPHYLIRVTIFGRSF